MGGGGWGEVEMRREEKYVGGGDGGGERECVGVCVW